ncbi:hypothetical protein N0V88_008064 [Collariella sp. IMI 366227]|nr:hypothetical protein N0V88_008064 [Collariella sp. IMI 366227]
MTAVQTTLEALAGTLPLILTTLAALLAVVLLQNFVSKSALKGIPVIGEGLGNDEKKRQVYLERAVDIYLEGYKKVVPSKFTVIVIPPKYLEELRKLPDDVVNANDAADQFMHTKYLKLVDGEPLQALTQTVKNSLTPALAKLNPVIKEEVKESMRRELPPCDDWTVVNIRERLLRIVSLASGRIFVGPEISRTEEYLDATINYTVELMTARDAVDGMRPWLRPFLANRLPEIKKLDQRLVQADKLLQPIVAARAAMKVGEKPNDMLQWIMDSQDKFHEFSTRELARMQLHVSFAAIHTTTLIATNVFYNLAGYPQYIPELRDEIRTTLAQHNGEFSSMALLDMKKLDSFLRETMRLYPVSASSFVRKVNKMITLSNGQIIPAGVIIEVPAVAIARDPEVFQDADKFMPWRFAHMREQAKAAGKVEAAAQNQFVSLDTQLLTFGYGRHACPGRYFAGNEVKMIVANFIMQYDMKLPDGVKERHPNHWFGAFVSSPSTNFEGTTLTRCSVFRIQRRQ